MDLYDFFKVLYLLGGVAYMEVQCSRGPKEGDRFPGAGVPGSCALLNLDAGNRTQTGPYENSENSTSESSPQPWELFLNQS